MAFIKYTGLLFAVVSGFIFLVKNDAAAAKNVNQPLNQKVENMKEKKKIVFLISEDPDNYEAHKTVPKFAGMLREKYGYDVTVLLGSGGHGSYRYPGMEIVSKADLLIVFARRIALPHEQMKLLKDYLKKGNPLIGIRTANHAFTVNGKIEEGFEDWPEFVADILGCKNRGYGPVGPGTEVTVDANAGNHFILKDFRQKQWHSNGNVYLVAPLLDTEAAVLLTGSANEITQPVAWTRTAGKSRVFYTSLGYPTDFETPEFIQLLGNAIQWALLKDEN